MEESGQWRGGECSETASGYDAAVPDSDTDLVVDVDKDLADDIVVESDGTVACIAGRASNASAERTAAEKETVNFVDAVACVACSFGVAVIAVVGRLVACATVKNLKNISKHTNREMELINELVE